MWWLKARLLAPLWFGRGTGFAARRIRYADVMTGDNATELPPYEKMAACWHDFSQRQAPNYAPFLAALLRRRGLPRQAVLDLGCGAGTTTQVLGEIFPQVTGLDRSPAMLDQARARCAAQPKTRFVLGDFRNFDLGVRFDAVLCARDSLNYLADGAELAQVLHRVADHLNPGGVLLCDTITERGMWFHSGICHHAEVGGTRFVTAFEYDAETRRQTARVHFASGIEIHRRIPIDPNDVKTAIQGTKLVLDDYFSYATVPGRWLIGSRCFFVLSREKNLPGP